MTTVVNRLRGRVADQPIDTMVVQSSPHRMQPIPPSEQRSSSYDGHENVNANSNFFEFLVSPKFRQALLNIQETHLNRQHLYDKG